MRIISGTLKGRPLVAPKNLPVRPTTDFARTGLFNILHNYFDFEAISVLDLYCGTGSISFEFASRGTKHITCVDEHSGCLLFIKEFAAKVKISPMTTVKKSAFHFIGECTDVFDIVFADPPFDESSTDLLPDLILSKKMVAPGGWLVVEHQAKRELKSHAKPFQVRKYGNCAFSIYQSDST